MTRIPHIAPWLLVRDAPAALAFYRQAFDAVERYRLEEHGRVIVAQLAMGEADFWLQEEPYGEAAAVRVRMIVTVDDPDAAFAQAIGAGAKEMYAVHDGFGWRIGRLADPFGHEWELGKPLA